MLHFLGKFSPAERAKIEIHTLNPDNHYMSLLENAGIPKAQQHAGIFETVPFKRFGGRFDVVTGFFSLGEKTGTTLYDNFRKIKNMLLPRGTCFVLVGHKGLRIEPTIPALKELLGKRFNLDLFKWDKRTFSHPVVFTRTR